MAVQSSNKLPAVGIPELHEAIGTARHQKRTICTEFGKPDSLGVTTKRSKMLAGGCIPQFDLFVNAGRSQHRSIWTEGYSMYASRVTIARESEIRRLGVPYLDVVVGTFCRRCQCCAIRAECHVAHGAGVSDKRTHHFPLKIPNDHSTFLVPGSNQWLVGMKRDSNGIAPLIRSYRAGMREIAYGVAGGNTPYSKVRAGRSCGQ